MLPKAGKVLPARSPRSNSDQSYPESISAALRAELGESHRAVKTVMSWTGAGERTTKNWFAGTRGPNGVHLIKLARHSDSVLRAFLQMAERDKVAVALGLTEVRMKLAQVVDLIDDMLATERDVHKN